MYAILKPVVHVKYTLGHPTVFFLVAGHIALLLCPGTGHLLAPPTKSAAPTIGPGPVLAGVQRPLRRPRFHVWHHDVVLHGRAGQNFGVVFSLWDWLFGTAYRPAAEHPERLGFSDMDAFPKGLLARLAYPLGTKRPA